MKAMKEEAYYSRPPKSYKPAHNHIWHVPGFSHGTNGFRRFWIPPQWVGNGWAECPCGWGGPKWKTHYAASEHVEWWNELIIKHGSLAAAHQHVAEMIRTEMEKYRAGVASSTTP